MLRAVYIRVHVLACLFAFIVEALAVLEPATANRRDDQRFLLTRGKENPENESDLPKSSVPLRRVWSPTHHPPQHGGAEASGASANNGA
jgi:hypothetical protein